MVESGCSTRLAAKTFQGLGVLRDIVRKKFEGDKAAERGVLGFVDHTHAAATQFLDDAVVRDGSPDHSSQILRG
jgi:hypothetical protein